MKVQHLGPFVRVPFLQLRFGGGSKVDCYNSSHLLHNRTSRHGTLGVKLQFESVTAILLKDEMCTRKSRLRADEMLHHTGNQPGTGFTLKMKEEVYIFVPLSHSRCTNLCVQSDQQPLKCPLFSQLTHHLLFGSC